MEAYQRLDEILQKNVVKSETELEMKYTPEGEKIFKLIIKKINLGYKKICIPKISQKITIKCHPEQKGMEETIGKYFW